MINLMNQETFNKYGFTFKAPSKRKNKKYDVYYDDIYLTSFGQLPYEHYEDKIGYYRDLNHYDKKRRDNYRTRHRHDNLDDISSAGFWSYYFLW
jgi:hypothetical protein